MSHKLHAQIFGGLALVATALFIIGVLFGVGAEVYENREKVIAWIAARHTGTLMAISGFGLFVTVVGIGLLTEPRR